MLNVTKHSANRLDIHLSDHLDADEMRDGIDRLIDLSEGVKGGAMYYEITNFPLPTLGALAVEMAHLPQMFGLLAKYDKCAVVTDTKWLRTAAMIEGKLLPHFEIRCFETKDAKKAEAWLDGLVDAAA